MLHAGGLCKPCRQNHAHATGGGTLLSPAAGAPGVQLCRRLPVLHVSSEDLQDHIPVQLEVVRVAVHAVGGQHCHCTRPVMLLQQQEGVAGRVGRCQLRACLRRLDGKYTWARAK